MALSDAACAGSRVPEGGTPMRRGWPGWGVIPAFLIAATAAMAPAASGQEARAVDVDESYFAERLHPVLHVAQCERCHNDNGVASESRLEFPGGNAGVD